MFAYTSINQYQHALTQGRTSCQEAVRRYLAEIEKSKHLNAFIHVFADEAIQKATVLDEKRKAGNAIGRLHGVVIAIKDVICYKDNPLTAASGILKNFTSLYSATAVEKLLEQEAIIIGVCNCDEFAMGSTNENSVYGNVLNAIDETRVPGGSSGGSAVAVQAGLCMVSLGSDTGGSVRQPADFCGIVGLKPTYGRISRYGLIAYASSFDQIGIFANNVEDAGIILETIAGPDDYDSTVSQESVEKYSEALKENKKFRFAYFKETLEHPSLDNEIANGINKLVEQIKDDGHDVTALSFEYLDYIVPAYYILTTAEASSNLSRYDGVRYGYRSAKASTDLTEFYKHNRSEGFGKEVKRRIMLGTFVLSTGYYDAYFAKAQKVRRKLVEKTELVFSEFDFILMPTSPSVAFKIGEKTDDPIAMYLADIYTVFANLTGIPGISLPLFKHSNGMPFGVQVMAKQFNELSLLKASQRLMEMFAVRRSPLEKK
ncbi:MAG TPA: Asp-tRNA(Asn)/Glu-tRNA(Gln) amidotransferase subunit GatA [Chitinophagaceae bacterium]|nr:Asp-tRNA(Asn)/Glu-tRNA(Gln) amidotransferase subunit GatA [Chitinophagaceae bacterium]